MTSEPDGLGSGPRLSFPQVGVRRAVEAALALYESKSGTRTLDEREFRSLLGHESASTDLVRLTIAMKMYGLLTTGKRGYTLTDQARRLLAAADQGEFRSLLFLTAMLPEGVRELPFGFTARLDTKEVEQALTSRQVAVRDRKTILSVLLDNEATLQRERLHGTLFEQVRAERAQRLNPGPLGWFEDARRWLNTLAGRTANLTMVALLFAGSLLYVALRPVLTSGFGLGRTVTAPVPELRVTETAEASSSAAAVPPSTSATSPPTALASNRASRSPIQETSSTSSAPALGNSATLTGEPSRPQVNSTPAPSQPKTVQPPTAPVAPVTDVAEPATNPSAPTVTQPEVQPQSPLTRGRELTALLFSGQVRSVWGAFSSPVRQEWGSYSAFATYRQGGVKDFGAETSMISEAVRRSGGVDYYTRTALFERGPRQPWTVIFGLDDGGRVVAFNIVASRVLPPLALASR